MLKDRIKEDIKKALKEKKEVICLTLRGVSAAILNKEKEKKYKDSVEDLTDEEIIDIISFEAKKRREAIVEYEKGNRKELADKERKELEVLQEYLPEQLSEEEIKVLITEAIKETGASDMKDMGKVMGVLATQVKGKADGGLVAKIVKGLLDNK